MQRRTDEFSAPAHLPAQGWIIAQAAALITLGNVASRLLGLVRETVIAEIFGASGLVSAFRTAALAPTLVYDLLIGGMISGALVPVFSEYADPARRSELRHVAGVVFSLLGLLLALVVLALELAAPLLTWALAGGLPADLLATTTDLTRLILPAILFFGLSGITTGLLYSTQRFLYPAFGAAIFNLGIILTALLFSDRLGIAALSLGVVLGSILQLLIQVPGLRGLRPQFRLSLDPALRRILLLYAPVVLGIVVSQIGIAIDFNLASRTGEQSRAWMQAATHLVQFPLGLVSAAISLAVLPSLAQFASGGEKERFRKTLGTGLRMVLFLILPAALGLLALSIPIIDLLFEHGAFTRQDTQQTALALRWYLIGMPFAAIDLLLIFAFYAHQDTRTPNLVAILSVLVYLLVALGTIQPLGFVGLVIADSCKHAAHSISMLLLAHLRLDALRGQRILTLLAKAGLASLGMALLAWGIASQLSPQLGDGLWNELTLVALAGGAGAGAYLLAVVGLGTEEIDLLWTLLRRRGLAVS
ncbi:MAG: murein biosynthesis integral membrane protein MurJ [Chloroflexi bacterium]|nr:murein biosynthesis integral membrane protein MurJ [Chloroflexota bacterium]